MYFRHAVECMCCHDAASRCILCIFESCPMCCWAALWPERCGSVLLASGGSWFLLLLWQLTMIGCCCWMKLTAEQVPQALRPLWTHLRLLLLESLWSGRGDAARGRAALSACRHSVLLCGTTARLRIIFFLGGASYTDGSHEPSDPRVRAEAPGNLANRGSPWAPLRPHSATAIGRQAQLAQTGPRSSPPTSKVRHNRPINPCS